MAVEAAPLPPRQVQVNNMIPGQWQTSEHAKSHADRHSGSCSTENAGSSALKKTYDNLRDHALSLNRNVSDLTFVLSEEQEEHHQTRSLIGTIESTVGNLRSRCQIQEQENERLKKRITSLETRLASARADSEMRSFNERFPESVRL
jgi:chromosome segregation ATPase